MTDAGLFLALSIYLYSIGHWIGGTIALACAIGEAVNRRIK
jgi:hypothetical protein